MFIDDMSATHEVLSRVISFCLINLATIDNKRVQDISVYYIIVYSPQGFSYVAS